MTHSLTLGSLLLTGSPAFADEEHGFWFEVAAEGTDFGTPEAVLRVVTSLLADGAIVTYDNDGNRTIPVRVLVNGPTLDAVAQGEAALRRESKVRNELTWQPPDDLAPASVYDTHPSSMSREQDGSWDLTELRHRQRAVRLSLACAPYAHPVEPVTIEALATGTTTVTVDTCDSATGWTGTRNGVATSGEGPSTIWEAGSVGIMELDNATGFPPETWTLTRTGAVDFTATRYLEVELTTLSAKAGAPLSVSAHLNGSATALPVLQMRRIADGSQYFRVTFDTGGVSASSITFKHTSAAGYGHAWQGLQVRNIARTDVSPNVTKRQSTRIIEVDGTERAPASIHIQSANGTAALDHVVAHTCPEDGSGYSPPLQRWRTVGQTRTPDATAFSGNYELINVTSWVAEVPTATLPEGGYTLSARMRAQVAATVRVSWSTSTIFPDSTTQQGFTLGQEDVDFPADQEWIIVPLAVLSLPSVRTKAGKVQIALQVEAASPSVTLDEAWLFREGVDCATTIVKTDRAHLWLDSPDLSNPGPTVWVGDGRETKVHPGEGLIAQGTHFLSPQGTALFTAALTDNPKADATCFELWHSNVAWGRS